MALENGRARAAAILVDFDNVCLGLANAFGSAAARSFALSPQAWLAWFSGGGHASPDDAGERRFIVRRAYINPESFRRSRQLQMLFANAETRKWAAQDEDEPFALFQRVQRAFTSAGIEIVDMPPVGGLRPSVPVRIAIDALELLDHATQIDEFVFLTGDADLSAVLQRLRAQGRATALLCEAGAAEAIEGLVDRVIDPALFVKRGFEGKPSVRSLIESVEQAMRADSDDLDAAPDDLEAIDVELDDADDTADADLPNYELLPRVARRVVEAIEKNGAPLESTDLLPTFREFKEFSQVRSDGRGAWFGAGGLANLVRRLAALEPRLQLENLGAKATRTGRLVDQIVVALAPEAKSTSGAPSAGKAEQPDAGPESSIVRRALDVIKDEVARSQTPLHLAYLRAQVLEELGTAAAAAGLADVGGKALKDAALRYGLAPFTLVEPRAGYVWVLDPNRHTMPE